MEDTLNIRISPTQFYTWKNYRCAYDLHEPVNSNNEGLPLLLIHPIGVGLSRQFWQRFRSKWYAAGHKNAIYNPDLLGCGDSDMPHVAYTPKDWAEQLNYFLQTVVKQNVVIVVQGALLPVAIELVQKKSNLIAGLILAGPPAWPVITRSSSAWQQKIAWNLFDSAFGNAFYRYARTEKFLRSFSARQLFASEKAVDKEWLNMLLAGAKNPETRHAVFSFLAGFWRQDYGGYLACIKQPTLVVVGETASSISKEGQQETPDERLADYLSCLPQGTGIKLPGRNVLPYESTTKFVEAIAPFITKLKAVS
ncbi:alpha/beta fold hydrolase [Umezakia ovalisporum]|jgi:pimeloyl-ACP methyl ester carboxylesterase|uniref:Alpha/beta hydrolase n=2 Tax=Umezakia ovalisporum TaxID=75695 RepID=A0AA43KE76_9CYAN|nr:alpha/beta hydrolase [Umezakia ovalisporum]MBI1241988.1 alpha/beta fold hydrolase [Nostoc sp. RI_552]MDH6056797.1 alpha/beta hydrolase [Umezakia ovalisporum FSS-43]MDH6062728.1 alpha/beta hydrolase [Umezakia ovalisporum FSS-62]MDH6068171.1 alpha/beta hydrolase [Umezakia ovalisporum APH033B]MDH6072212.1 alpha/beta hydrolase [Umezakia ovalisporum CobakiLakeA]